MKQDVANPPVASGGMSSMPAQVTVFGILAAISLSHFLNDVIQSLIPAIYPMLKENFHLNFSQIGLITFTFQLCASLLQPVIGSFTDKRPQPYSLACGMGVTLCGLVLLSMAQHFAVILTAAGMVGFGSSVFHPEASRVARMASGGKHGLAQSLFQVGGNAGTAAGPLLAAFVVLPFGQRSIAWFSIIALLGIGVMIHIGRWYTQQRRTARRVSAAPLAQLSQRQVVLALAVLFTLLLSKFLYLSSINSYLTFYVIDRFGLSVQSAQMMLFLFLAASAVGTVAGGPIGDRIGRKYVIWISIVGCLPFTLALPYAGLAATWALVAVIAMILSAAFSAIVVYAQELVPGRVGMIAGLFFGLAFGISGIGAAALGVVADGTSIGFVYRICSFLPLLGLLTVFLPNLERKS
jgi:FSR family fosmidomycin resistance protein-like MFS transporter